LPLRNYVTVERGTSRCFFLCFCSSFYWSYCAIILTSRFLFGSLRPFSSAFCPNLVIESLLHRAAPTAIIFFLERELGRIHFEPIASIAVGILGVVSMSRKRIKCSWSAKIRNLRSFFGLLAYIYGLSELSGIGLASIKWTPIQAALMSFSFCLFSKATGEI
jgi:hypothetical protein